MDDYALVLNAGSSSLKFCVYRRPEGHAWSLEARGQIDGIGTAPRFTAKDSGGAVVLSETLDKSIGDVPAALNRLAAQLRAKTDAQDSRGIVGRRRRRFRSTATKQQNRDRKEFPAHADRVCRN